MMVENVGTFSVMGVKRLPFKIVGRTEVKPWEDKFPGIPFVVGGRVLSSDERANLFAVEVAKAERAAKKAAKIAAGWTPKPSKAKEGKIVIPRTYPQPAAKPSAEESRRLFREENERLIEANTLRLQAIRSAKDSTIHTVKVGKKWVQATQDDLDAMGVRINNKVEK
jgi:hypothetical protein